MAVPPGGNVSSGIKLGRGPHVLTETVHPATPATPAPPLQPLGVPSAPKVDEDPSGERTDALTKKPLDLEGSIQFQFNFN